MAIKKLVVFESTYKRIKATHHFWEDSWVMSDYFKTFDPANDVALITDQSTKLYNSSGYLIQPNSWAANETTVHTYVDESTLPALPNPDDDVIYT